MKRENARGSKKILTIAEKGTMSRFEFLKNYSEVISGEGNDQQIRSYPRHEDTQGCLTFLK